MAIAAVPVGPDITATGAFDYPYANPGQIVRLPSGGFIMFWSESAGADGSAGCVEARVYDANGNATTGVLIINTSTLALQGLPRATLLQDGTIMVTWQDHSATSADHDSGAIRGQIITAAGAKIGGEFLVNTTTTGSQSAPTNTLLDNGNVLVLWTDFSLSADDPSGQAIRGQIVTPTGTKVGGEFLVNTQTSGFQNNVHVAKLAGGNIMVTWVDSLGDASGSGVKAQMFDGSGAKIGGEFLVNTQTAGTQNLADVAALANGTFVVTWQDASATLGDASGTSIKAQIFDGSGARIGGEFLVNTGTTAYNQTNPTVAGLSDGTFVIAWRDEGAPPADPTHWMQTIHAQMFSATGTPIGDEFYGATPAENTIQGYPTIADLGDGRFIIAQPNTYVQPVGNGQFSQATRGEHAQIFQALHQVIGTPNDDALNGTAGADFIDGQMGADTLHGLAGNDVIDGGDGNDTIYGEDGDDAIEGGTGADTIYGGAGDDTIDGGDGDDTLDGGTGNNTIYGGEGDDIITSPSGGTGVIDGEGGNDRITVTNASFTTIDGGDGDDQIFFNGGSGVNSIDGGVGANTITASVASNATISIQASSENSDGDLISIGTGMAYVTMGPNDTVQMIGPSNNVHITGNIGRQTVVPGNGAGTIDISYYFHAGEAGDTLDLSVFGADPFGPGGPLTIQNSSATTPGSALIINTVTGLRINIYGVDARDLSSFNLGGVANPLYAPQNHTIDSVFASNPTADWYDYLVGADGNDLIRAYGGNDMLFGAGGNDRLDGGLGTDAMDGGTGNDTFVVDDAGDVVIERPGEGADTVEASISYALGANVENLTLSGSGNTNATGNALVNVLRGNSGNNRLDGAAGADTLIGGTGNDAYVYDPLDTIVENANEGIDTIESGVTLDLASFANIENLTLTGTGDIEATGNALVNVLTGNSGANRLTNVGAGDTLVGGAGDDTYLVTDSSTAIVEGVGGGNDTIKTTVSYVLGAGVEVETLRLANGSAGLNLTGNGFSSKIIGNGNDNVIDGGGGGDTMRGGLGNDTYIVRDAADAIVDAIGEGDDTVKAAVGYTLAAAAEVEHLWALDFAATTAINLTGNDYSHDIQGNAGVNVLTGGSGDDFLTGNGGADTLIGGAGNDTYLITDAAAAIVEGAGGGNDTIKTTVSYVLAAGAEVETIRLAFGSAGLNLTGNGYSSKILGNGNDNVLDGGGGGDTLRGGLGNDTYIVRDASDRIVEASGEGTDVVQAAVSYTLTSDAFVETLRTIDAAATTAINLTGNDHTLAIQGNAGANVLTGGAGNETISGFAGNDTLFGGGGNDVFAFATGTGQDSVGDFVSGSDRLDLSAFFTSFAAVQAATQDVGGNAVIDLGGGNSVTLSGFLTAQLQSGDVILGGGGGASPFHGGAPGKADVSRGLMADVHDVSSLGLVDLHDLPPHVGILHHLWGAGPAVFEML